MRFVARAFRLGVPVILGTASLPGQSPVSFTGDFGVTVATGHGSSFDRRTMRGPSFGVSADLVLPGRFGLFGEFSSTSLGPRTGQSTTCLIASNPCRLAFPEMHGWNYDLGLTFHPARSAEARLGLGIGRFFANDDVSLRPLAFDRLVEVAAFPISHFGVVAAFEEVALPRYFRGSLSLRMLRFAVRAR
jgi:hypothetical protein